jgi:outer membrane receptor for ferrienterochelin and colicin
MQVVRSFNRVHFLYRICVNYTSKRGAFFMDDNLKLSVISLILLIQITAVFGQSEKTDIKGYVIDAKSGENLPYANVTVKGEKIGATTNTEGYFIILNVPLKVDTLEIFYIGYVTKIVDLKNMDRSKTLTIKMEQSFLETEAITVTAEEYQIWKKSDEVSQITFSPMQISSLPNLGEADIFRSLQLLPGISGVSDGSAGLYIRGGTPDQNLVLLDGMTVYHVDHFFGFFSAFNADAIKDVQVFKGGFPSIYGGRLSSVVDLTGKTGNVNETRIGLGINLLSVNGLLEVPLFEKGSFIISARRSYTDIIQNGMYINFYDFLFGEENPQSSAPGPGQGRRGQQTEEIRPAFYYYDLNAKLSYNPSRKDAFALSFYSGKDNLNNTQELGGLKFGGSDEDDVFGTRITEEITDWGNIGSSFKWSRQWHDRFSTNFLFAGSQYLSNYDHNARFEDESGGSGLNDSISVFRGGGFASEEDNKINDMTFRLDSDWHLSDAHRLGFGTWISQIETDYKATLNDTIDLFSRNNKSMQYALYLQDKWQLSDPWQLTLGLRTTAYDKTNQFYFEPRAAINYSFTDHLTLKGAWGYYHQFIHRIANENILDGSRDFWLIADEDLIPESSEHYIAGISYEDDDYLLEIEAFHKNMDNLIEYSRRFQTGADYGELFFFGSGISKGIELLAQKKAGAFNGWLSYTFSDVEYNFPNFNNGDPFPASHERPHEFKSVATYSYGKWSFAATWVFASGQPYTSPENQYFLELLTGDAQSYIHVSDKNTNRLPEYHRLDISVSYHLVPPTDNWGKRKKNSWDGEIGLSIYNLYNNNNVWYRKYDLDVTPVTITNVNMLGFTPSVYLKLNF